VHHRYLWASPVNDYTATAYSGLYCDRSTDRNLVQSFIYVGAIIGLWVLTPLADERGPKKMFIIALALCISGVLRTSQPMQWT
jgi:MFS family permease